MTHSDLGATAGRAGRHRRGQIVGLLVLILLVVILRHDYWQWNTPGYLLLGFLPVGLWWQAMVSIAAAVMMGILVRVAWPQNLQDSSPDSARPPH